MIYVDEFSTLRWRRWNRTIFPAVARARTIGLWTRSASADGDRFADLHSDLVAYGSLCRASISGYDRRRLRRMLAQERRDVRAKVQRLGDLGNRVWWSIRRDCSGVDILIAGKAWSPESAALTSHARKGRPAQLAAPIL